MGECWSDTLCLDTCGCELLLLLLGKKGFCLPEEAFCRTEGDLRASGDVLLIGICLTGMGMLPSVLSGLSV